MREKWTEILEGNAKGVSKERKKTRNRRHQDRAENENQEMRRQKKVKRQSNWLQLLQRQQQR